eukprot:g11664.t1
MKMTFAMLAFIGQCIEYRSWEVMSWLYRILVRPLLEYCMQFWSPCYGKDVVKLERVQKRFKKMEGLNYRERLNRLGLRSDLIEVYKIMRGMDR